jgi:PAS domain S-box-containing protein
MNQEVSNSMSTSRFWKDPVWLATIGTVIGLGILEGGLGAIYGHGQALGEWPAFVPMMHGFTVLAAVCIAFLAFGRYQTLRDPIFYWLGLGYSGFGVAEVFYILAWPDLLPGGRSLIAQLPSTSAWIGQFAQSFLILALLGAILSRWPKEGLLRGTRWLGSVAVGIGLATLACTLIVLNEQRLPVLIAGAGFYTLLILAWNVILMLVAVSEGFLAARLSRVRDEPFLGYLAVGIIAFDFCVIAAIIGTQRYDVWFYLSRVIGVYALLVTLFGLLSEFPRLMRRERENQARIAAEREWFQTTLASIGDAVITTDAAGKVTYLNAVAEGLSGWTSKEAAGLPLEQVFNIIDEQTGAAAQNPVSMVLQKGMVAGLANHTALITRSGQIIPIEDSAAPIRVGSGRLLGVVMVFHEVTQKRVAEKTLREALQAAARSQRDAEASEARERVRAAELEALMDTIPAFVWVSRDSACREMISNRYGYDFLNISPGGNVSMTAPPEEFPQHHHVFQNDEVIPGEDMPMQIAARTGQPQLDHEFEVVFDNGATHYLFGNAAPLLDLEGKPCGAVGVYLDITALKRAEQEAQRLTAENEIKHRLIEQREQERQQIARDLHDGPIQDLTRATFDLQALVKDGCAPEIAQQLEAVQKAIRGQIGELRTYAGELRPPTLAKFGLGNAIRSHLESFQEKHPEIQLLFEETEHGGLLPEVARLALFRIYQETLTNIAKHAQAKTVTIRLVKVREEVILEIQDDGIGFEVPKEWLDLARRGHLGLVGMRERAEAIGGTLEIRSRPGKGASLRICAPLAPQPAVGEQG